MKLTHLKLEDLKPAALNVRKIGGKRCDDLIPSIRAHGLLQPLLVRPNCEGYEIVAGQRRYHALTKLAENGESEPVPCIVMQDGDDAAALEASLAENIARLPMDEIDQYKAFAALVKRGREIADIAATFGVTERLVRQRLAIANLEAPILTLYRKDDIGADTLRILTMASRKQQKAWLELWRGEDYAPVGHRLRNWLFGGAQIPVCNALFDAEESGLAITSDLFGDEAYFADAEGFWPLQNTAVAEAKDAYLAEGWADVVVLEVGEHFPAYEYVDTDKDAGGRVYVRIGYDGEVTFYEGHLPRKEAATRERADAGGKVSTAVRPELTQAMQNYLELHRHAAVRAALLDHQGIAPRLAVAQIIAGSELWSVRAHPQKARNEAIAASLTQNRGEDRMSAEQASVLGLLALDEDSGQTLVPRKDDWGAGHDLHGLFVRLLGLSDEDVLRVLTYVVAECLPAGGAMIEALGSMLDVDMKSCWQPDDAFFDLLRDKEAINAMVREIAGKRVADAHTASTAKVQKGVIRQCLDGTRAPEQPDWQPRYMTFPMRAYTKRDGIAVIDQWQAVKKHYA